MHLDESWRDEVDYDIQTMGKEKSLSQMLQEVLKKNKMIKLTDNALLHLRSLIKEHNKKFVRLQVKGGGCALNTNGHFQMKKQEMM